MLFLGNDNERELKIWLGIGSVEKLAKSLGKLKPVRRAGATNVASTARAALTLSILCRPQPIPLATAPSVGTECVKYQAIQTR